MKRKVVDTSDAASTYSDLVQTAADQVGPLAQAAADRLEAAAVRVGPLAHQAADRLEPLAQKAAGRVAPLAQQAQEFVTPYAQSAADKPWRAYITSVDALESLTGYDFLSTVPTEVQRVIEARIDGGNS